MVAPAINLGRAFDEVVRRYASNVALRYPDNGVQISYGELHKLVLAIANELQNREIRQGQVVAIFHDKSPRAFAAMLACLRLGAIYTNLDPESPWERLRRMLDTCQPSLLISGSARLACESQITAAGYRDILHLASLDLDHDRAVPHRAGQNLPGSSPAYIMFTSGSTGVPKGAVMSHANVLWFILWSQQRFAITSGDVLTNVNPMYFDNSVFDFYSALFSGATLVPFDALQVRSTRSLVRFVGEAGCTLWFSVPSLLVYLLTTRALESAHFPAVRCIAFGGEGFPKRRLRELFTLFGHRAALENVYGPTECTCICSAYTISEEDFADMQSLAPLGHLAPNFDYELLPVDADATDTGELFLRGPQVGLGYYRDRERSSRSFLQNPCDDRFADVGYRTGDLVRRDSRGRLHFLGRVDNQIKHMGYRIELEEIEAALSSLRGVQECAVVFDKGVDGPGQILAFAVVDHLVDAATLRSGLATLLPAYMLPRTVTPLSELPKNANGKIDRGSLLSGARAAKPPAVLGPPGE